MTLSFTCKLSERGNFYARGSRLRSILRKLCLFYSSSRTSRRPHTHFMYNLSYGHRNVHPLHIKSLALLFTFNYILNILMTDKQHLIQPMIWVISGTFMLCVCLCNAVALGIQGYKQYVCRRKGGILCLVSDHHWPLLSNLLMTLSFTCKLLERVRDLYYPLGNPGL
jgi:hypothetical protein